MAEEIKISRLRQALPGFEPREAFGTCSLAARGLHTIVVNTIRRDEMADEVESRVPKCPTDPYPYLRRRTLS
jgi:hypothetical protein